jgi:anthranilate phosphoribosyltransferase
MSANEHPFAPYVRILGKGKQGSRSLTAEEARAAMGMILDREVLPEQLGAFLMLLRVKEEQPDELAGFARAVRERLPASGALSVDLDWSTYAGKRRHLPWFLLSALVLAGSGVRVFMHGAGGHTPGRLYVEDQLHLFGLKTAESWLDAELQIQQGHFCYASLDIISPVLADIIQLRPVLGLRSPVHTLCRMLNPLDAPYRIDGVFHPAYGPMHQQTAKQLGQNNSVTIKGDGGEAEIRPDHDCVLQWVRNGEYEDQIWPRQLTQRAVRESSLEPLDLLTLWRGASNHDYGEAAVLDTLSVCLKLLGRADSVDQARKQAQELWQQRDRALY